MSKAIVTISTASHLFKVRALHKSLKRNGENSAFYCLVVDKAAELPEDGIQWLQITEVKSLLAEAIVKKYSKQADKLRWCLKPVVMQHLFAKGYEKVLYMDNDLWFDAPAGPLWQFLEGYKMLLTPHDYPRFPDKQQNWLEANFRVGLFNAGLVGGTNKATELLQWWAGCCLYRCEKNYWRGLFDDQKYLDLLPVMDKEVGICHHKGMNVASWNTTVRPRRKEGNRVFVGGDQLVFIHFNPYTCRQIIEGIDPLLQDAFQRYLEDLNTFKPGISANQLYTKQPTMEKLKLAVWKWLNRHNKQ